MLRNCFQSHGWPFWKISDFDQFWDFGSLTYCRNALTNTRKYQSIFNTTINFASFKISDPEHVENACIMFANLEIWNFEALKFCKFEIVKF